jgi:two-component system response regulator HydG
VRRIGADKTLTVDVRLIAATNMDLVTLIQEKRFREDLYYRINTAVLQIPPLRERKEDIPLLVDHLLLEKNGYHENGSSLTPEALNLFMSYSWPGNIRELKNVLEYSLAMSGGQKIGLHHVPPLLQNLNVRKPRPDEIPTPDKQHILETLKECRFNKKLTAERLGISRKTLYEKMKKHEIEY